MIRTTCEGALFGLWRDVSVLDALVKPEHLTTARYEPVVRSGLGSGVVDVLFEASEQSCVIPAIRLDSNSLVTRERSPFVWPAGTARLLDADRLLEVERFLTPWLRSLARGRAMAQEATRRFSRSERFERARAAELFGATRLAVAMRHMAPFVYARRFAAGSNVFIDCADQALGHAMLADLAATIAHPEELPAADRGDREFARAWYGIDSFDARVGVSELVLVDAHGEANALIVVETSSSSDAVSANSDDSGSSNAGAAESSSSSTARCVTIDVPSPAPLDLLFSFDAADAPVASRFSVRAVEPSLRELPPFDRQKVIGGSAGTIVLAMNAEALAMRGADVGEAETLIRCLTDEGLSASIAIEPSDPALAVADLVHIFGATFEAHTVAFAQAARERGIDFVFDVPPRPCNPSGYIENMLLVALRAGSDDAETARYLAAYEERRASGSTVPEPSAEEYAQVEARFADLAASAVAVLCAEEDVAGLTTLVTPAAAARVLARGVFGSPEPSPAPIGHLVPSRPFAFIHAPIAARSHALFPALIAQRRGIPLVIAGPCYDVEYLQTLRTIAPTAVVLADAAPGIVSAIYRRATTWIDAAPRPRSAASLSRAVACGALPVLALESPLAGIAGPSALTFELTSLERAAAAMAEAITLSDRDLRLAALHERLALRSSLSLTFGGLMTAYARAATAV